MTNLDKTFITIVGIFAVLTIVYLCSDTLNNVAWTIYAFGLKDFLIIALTSLFIGKSKLSDLFAIALICYLSVPTILRIKCAINSNFDYTKYRELLNNSEYSLLLLLILLFSSIIIYYNARNERKN